MRQFICTTTIHHPTEALQAFDALPDWTLIVAGDLKTPADFKLERGIYLSPKDQADMDVDLSQCIGWNCIQRRNFAFLMAHKLGADVVATVDDDNLPLSHWGKDLLIGRETETRYFETVQPCFDPVFYGGKPRLWHRGFPLQLLSSRLPSLVTPVVRTLVPKFQADFWNGDPDVDALCRLEHAPDCEWRDHYFPMASSRPGPFNSQNTFLSADVLKDYFVFPFVGRMDDIWASFYVQALGHRVVWNRASVIQRRLPSLEGSNPNSGGGGHINNLKGELLGYEHNLEICQRIPSDPECIWEYCPGRTRRAFELYRRHFLKPAGERRGD